MFIDISSAVGTGARFSSLPRLVGNSDGQRGGSSGGVHLCARVARRVQRSFQGIHESSAGSASVPGTYGCRSSRSDPLRVCRVRRAAQPRAARPAAGTALLPKRSAAKNRAWSARHSLIASSKSPQESPLHFTAAALFVVISEWQVECSLGECTWESRPTRPQHPTACRSLGRRFAPRFSATLRVALGGTKGTRPGERQSVSRIAAGAARSRVGQEFVYTFVCLRA
jgi:hypothetical protein